MRKPYAIIWSFLFALVSIASATFSSAADPLTDNNVENGHGYRRIGSDVQLYQNAVDDDLTALRDVKGITSIQWAFLISGAAGPFITDRALETISQWKDLKVLNLPVYPSIVHGDESFFTDEGLKKIQNMTQLEKLYLNGHAITNVGLSYLRNLTGLKSLHITSSDITSKGLLHLDNLLELEDLDINSAGVLDEGMKAIGKHKKLQTLRLNIEATDKGLEYLTDLSELKSLSLRMHITDGGLKSIAGFHKLEHLSLDGAHIAGKGLNHLNGLSNLKSLNLNSTDVSNDGITYLKELHSLEFLDLSTTKVGDEGLRHIKEFYNLKRLSLNWNSITDEGMDSIAELRNLRELKLYNNRLTDRGLLKLKNLKSLTVLDVQNTQVTDQGVEELKKALPNLEVFITPKQYRDQGGYQPINPHIPVENDAMRIEWIRTTNPDDLMSTGQSAVTNKMPLIENHPILGIKRNRDVNLVAFSPDSKWLASNDFPMRLRLHDVSTGDTIVEGTPPPGFHSNSMAVSRDGKIIAVGCPGGEARLIDTSNLKVKAEFSVCQSSIYALALSWDGNKLACCAGDGTVQIWNIEKNEKTLTLGHKGERMSSMAFSGDGNCLAVLSRYGILNFWDVSSGKLLATSRSTDRGLGGELDEVFFLPDGKTAVISTADRILCWDTERKITDLFPVPSLIRTPYRTSVSPDLSTAASTNRHGSIFIWEVHSGRIMHIFKSEFMGDVIGGGYDKMVFSQDAKLLATGNRNGQIEIWKIK
jgi:WD40 repeat protein